MSEAQTLFLQGFSLSKPALLVLFSVAILLWLIMSTVFVFHWRRYGMDARFVLVTQVVYFLISSILIISALIFYFII